MRHNLLPPEYADDMYVPEFLTNFDWRHKNEGYHLLLQKELCGRATVDVHLDPRSGGCISPTLERFAARSLLSFS